MNAIEVNVLLTEASFVDSKMKRTDPGERANMAAAWAEVLPDVSLEDALAAMRAHYRESREPVTPSDILTLAGAAATPYPYQSIDAELEQAARARALEAAGVSEAEYLAHEHDVEWLRAHFVTPELEGDRA